MKGNPIWTLEEIEQIVRELIAQSDQGVHIFELKIECVPVGIAERKIIMLVDYLKTRRIIYEDKKGILHKNPDYIEKKKEGSPCKLCEDAYKILNS